MGHLSQLYLFAQLISTHLAVCCNLSHALLHLLGMILTGVTDSHLIHQTDRQTDKNSLSLSTFQITCCTSFTSLVDESGELLFKPITVLSLDRHTYIQTRTDRQTDRQTVNLTDNFSDHLLHILHFFS